jgi:hypothetical protein
MHFNAPVDLPTRIENYQRACVERPQHRIEIHACDAVFKDGRRRATVLLDLENVGSSPGVVVPGTGTFTYKKRGCVPKLFR